MRPLITTDGKSRKNKIGVERGRSMYLKHTLNIVIAGSESSVAFVISYEVITRTYRVLKRHMNNQTVPDFLPQQKSKRKS